jgi:hypothetical protein
VSVQSEFLTVQELTGVCVLQKVSVLHIQSRRKKKKVAQYFEINDNGVSAS